MIIRRISNSWASRSSAAQLGHNHVPMRRQEWITAHRQNQKGFRPPIASFGSAALPLAVTVEHMTFIALEYACAYALAASLPS